MPTASALNLVIDITNPAKSGILQSFQNRLPATAPLLIRNDVESVSLRFVQPSLGSSRPWDDVNYSTSAATTALGLGEFDVLPTSGTFTLQFGPRTTGDVVGSSTTVNITGLTSGIASGMIAAGLGIIPGTTITIAGSVVTLSAPATSTHPGATLYFYNETGPIATGASAATVSTAVNALTSIIGASGVVVTQPELGTYLMTLNATGPTPGYFAGSATGLNPASSIVSSEVVIGQAGIASEQLIEIFVNAYALQTSWTNFPSASATVTAVATGASVSTTGTTTSASATLTSLASVAGIVVGMAVSGLGIPASSTVLSIGMSSVIISNPATATGSSITFTFATPSVQSVAITAGAYDGSLAITSPLITTQAIAVPLSGTTAQSIQTSLNALGANYSVTGNAGGPWAISDPTGNNTALTVNVSNLIVPIGLTGTLTLSTYAMLQKFISSGLSEISLDLECQVTPSGGGQSTPLQIPVQVNKNVINLSALVPSPTVSFYTKAQTDAAIAAALAGSTVGFFSTITALSSGAGTLSGIVTASGAIAIDDVKFFLVSGVTNGWFLKAGTTATGAGIQRPDDYNASTNAVFWQQFI